MAMTYEELIDIVRPAGFFNQKAGYLQTVTRWYAQYGYRVEKVRKLTHAYLLDAERAAVPL